MSVFVETQGCCDMARCLENHMEIESSKCYVNHGALSSLRGSADGRNVPSLEFPYRLTYPEKDQNQPVDKMEPDCLKKYYCQSPRNVNSKSLQSHHIKSLTGKIKRTQQVSHTWGNWGYGGLSLETNPNIHKPNGRMWKRASAQSAAKSLEWVRRGGS